MRQRSEGGIGQTVAEHKARVTMEIQRNGFKRESYILSVDVGTTSIRCHVFDKEAQIRGSCITKVLDRLDSIEL